MSVSCPFVSRVKDKKKLVKRRKPQLAEKVGGEGSFNQPAGGGDAGNRTRVREVSREFSFTCVASSLVGDAAELTITAYHHPR